MNNKQISSYRLGDLILLELSIPEKKELFEMNGDSIGREYIVEWRKLPEDEKKNIDTRIRTLTKIVLNRMIKYQSFMPTNIENCIVVHLRLGDVVAGTQDREKIKRPFSLEYYENLIPIESRQRGKIYVISSLYFAKTSSTNKEECIKKSNQYLDDFLTKFDAIYYNGGNADIDLCLAVQSNLFIQGRGYYSSLITKVRRMIGRESIECDVSE